jgi:hypothetical protein
MNKLQFLQQEFIAHLAKIQPDTKPQFGKMNLHQMIEHMTDAFLQAAGEVMHPPIHDEETTQKMYNFMMSDKPFRDNTPNPYMPDEPPSPVTASIQEAIDRLQKAIQKFVSVFHENPELRIQNPFFGNLNVQEWTHLLHKHALHHLRQFNVIIATS